MKKLLTILLFLGYMANSLFAQTTISGTITDATTKSPLPGAAVLIKGTITGTATDGNGKFSLTTNQKPPFTLRVSSIGYGDSETEVSTVTDVSIALMEETSSLSELTVTGNRVEEKITKSPVTIEKLSGRQLQLSPAFDQYSALQSLKGVDLLSQNLIFKSVNMRGFGANNNNRFVQLTDGMDNRSPGLGFGFGSAAGVSDLDIESIEIIPGASSALYGPDALQGLMLTNTKSPFDYQGLTGQVKFGVNNIGKSDRDASPYGDIAVRYAKQIGNKFAFKINFQTINGTDFIADDYNDRMTRGRRGFFVNNASTGKTAFGYYPNNNPATNFEYDGVNIYGDDVTNAGSFDFPATHAVTALAGRRVTRTGYKEVDLTGDNGRIFSHRVNAAAHYRLNDKLELIGAAYWGNGNIIRTAGFREYFPSVTRLQAKLELRGDEFFVRAYNTSQKAEGYSLGVLAQRILISAKTTTAWATDFSNAYNTNSNNLVAARATADANKPPVGSAAFNDIREKLINTPNNLPTGAGFNGAKLLDNSKMSHAEGMYNFKKLLGENLKDLEILTGASFRNYQLETQGTVFPTTKENKEFTINEYGWYTQAAYRIGNDAVSFKPIVAVRYDKNQYFKGGFTPRISGVLSVGEHNFRGSWQSAFRNPSPNQLLADGKTAEVGGSQTALEAANLYSNPAYTEASINAFRSSGGTNQSLLVKYLPLPENFTTEKIKTWELGYKSLIANKFYFDAFVYRSTYNDFIATQNYGQPKTSGSIAELANSATTTTYGINFNNFNEIFVNGFGLGVDWALGSGYSLGANYARQIGTITLKDNAGKTRVDPYGKLIEKRRMSDLEVSAVGRNFFISPENRYNVTFANPKVTDRIGFSIAYRWTDEMWVEQGNTQGDVLLPSWTSVDAAVTYKLPKVRSMIKVGGSNILNKYYSQGYGLAQIGALYYVAFTYGIN